MSPVRIPNAQFTVFRMQTIQRYAPRRTGEFTRLGSWDVEYFRVQPERMCALQSYRMMMDTVCDLHMAYLWEDDTNQERF
jgi:hypothetical protein